MRLFIVKTFARIAQVGKELLPTADKPIRMFLTAVCAESPQKALEIVVGELNLAPESWKLELMQAHDVGQYARTFHIDTQDLSDAELRAYRVGSRPHPDDDPGYTRTVEFAAAA